MTYVLVQMLRHNRVYDSTVCYRVQRADQAERFSYIFHISSTLRANLHPWMFSFRLEVMKTIIGLTK